MRILKPNEIVKLLHPINNMGLWFIKFSLSPSITTFERGFDSRLCDRNSRSIMYYSYKDWVAKEYKV